MRANYRNTIKKLSGNTADIVSVVMKLTTRLEASQRTGSKFKDSSVRNTVQKYFDFIVKNVRYKEDPRVYNGSKPCPIAGRRRR